MEKSILNFHFDYLSPSLTKVWNLCVFFISLNNVMGYQKWQSWGMFIWCPIWRGWIMWMMKMVHGMEGFRQRYQWQNPTDTDKLINYQSKWSWWKGKVRFLSKHGWKNQSVTNSAPEWTLFLLKPLTIARQWRKKRKRTNVTIHLFTHIIWGLIWKHTLE